MERHALLHHLVQQLPGVGVFMVRQEIIRQFRAGRLLPRRLAPGVPRHAPGQFERPVAAHPLGGHKHQRLLPPPEGEVFCQRQNGLALEVAVLSGPILRGITVRPPLLGRRFAQLFLSRLAAVEAAVVEDAGGRVERALAQIEGALAVNEQLAIQPCRQPAGVIAQHGRKADELRRIRRGADLGEQQIHRGAPVRFAQHLDFVRHHESHPREHLGLRHQVGLHFFIDGDEQVEAPLQRERIRLGPLAGGDSDAVAQGAIPFAEQAVFFLGQRFRGDQIDDAAILLEVLERRHLGDERLARGGGGENEKALAMEKAMVRQRLLLQRQQAQDAVGAPDRDDAGRDAESEEVFDGQRHMLTPCR